MWTQLLSIAALVSMARGMCFGVPLMQQPVDCPEPMVYYPQLCICIEPKHKEKLHESGTIRRLPVLDISYPRESFKDKLQALRYRLSASLPDMVSHGHGSSVGGVRRNPFYIFPDRLIATHAHASSIFNNDVPRSWKIGGLLEAWSRDAFTNAGEIPTIETARIPKTGSWDSAVGGTGQTPEDISTLSLMDRLQTLRNLLRESSRIRAEKQLGDAELAAQFLKRLPSTGISPDTTRSLFQFAAGVPDFHAADFLKEVAVAQRGNSLLSRKEAALVKPMIEDIVPKVIERKSRPNSYQRSLMRMKQARRV